MYNLLLFRIFRRGDKGYFPSKREMKTKKESNLILMMVLIAVILIAGSTYYVTDLRDSLRQQCVSEVMEVTAQATHAFEIYIKKDMESRSRLVRKLEEKSSYESEEIHWNLDIFGDSDNIYAAVDLANGLFYYNEEPEAMKLTDEQLVFYNGLGDEGMLEPYRSEYTGLEMLGYYERFNFSDGEPGIVLKVQPISQIVHEFSLSFYDGTGFSYVIDVQGDVIVYSEHRDNNFSNFFDMIESSKNGEEGVEDFREKIGKGESGISAFMLDGSEHVVAFMPIDGTRGWYLVSVIPNVSITKHTNNILRVSRIFIFVFVLGLLFLTSFLLLLRWNRKRVQEKEREIRYREQLFNILVNNTNDVFLMISTDTYEMEYLSPNVERILGIPYEKVRDDLKMLGKVTYSDGDLVTYGSLANMKTGGSISRESERIHQRTGDRRNFLETIYRASVEGTDKFIIVLSDRTAERKNKAALQEALEIAKAANEAKSAFLSNMSHDIRTPMNAIIGFVMLLQKDSGNPERVKEYTRKIAASSQHLLSLINDVLDMSKIESGKTTLNITEFHLAQVIDELGTIMRPQASAKRQEFDITVYDITTEYLLGDKLRINQVLMNILSNAVKYTPIGGRVEMQVRQLPQDTKNFARIRFVIKDSGIGMSEEYLAEIFTPFTREVNTMTNKIQGTGLGMAITKNLVDLMGGTIRVESAAGQGSIFTVDLELRIMEQEVDQRFWEKHKISHIMVVDDEEDICNSIIRTMEDTGIWMEYALSGESAIQKTVAAYREEKGFDLVLLDWKMPGMDGIETARQIRKAIPKNIPILILTSYDWSEIESEAIDAGIDGFLPKPFFLSNFKEVITSINEKGAEAEKKKDDGKQELGNVFEGRSFLIAEDNELNAEILMELLDGEGAQCERAENGKEALEMFEQCEPGRYDMILMDIQMPVMDGYEATRRIRACGHPQAQEIPIVAMTANAFAEDVKNAIDSGMNVHIAKPIDMERLKDAVRKFIINEEDA